MRNVTLVYLVKGEHILLGMKKRGFGKGKWNGLGGKLNSEETLAKAAVREVKEEIGVDLSEENLRKVGELDFFFTNAPKGEEWDQKVHVYLIDKWIGEPIETEEIKPEWFDMKDLPFSSMWADDPHWMPLVLSGEKVKGRFTFGEDNEKIIKKFVNIAKANEF
ncbi:MAG: 8-oxo-dGTP diphosphatase [Candidatus Woesearchaeota archaeon]